MRKFSIFIYSVIIYLITYSSFEPSDIVTKINNTTAAHVLAQYYKDFDYTIHHGKKCGLDLHGVNNETLLADYYSEYSAY